MEIIERITTLRLKACSGAIATKFSRNSAVLLTIVTRRQYHQRQLRQPQNHERAQVSCLISIIVVITHLFETKVKNRNINFSMLLSGDLGTYLFLVIMTSSGIRSLFGHRVPHVLPHEAFTH
jgi:hypothetical protein